MFFIQTVSIFFGGLNWTSSFSNWSLQTALNSEHSNKVVKCEHFQLLFFYFFTPFLKRGSNLQPVIFSGCRVQKEWWCSVGNHEFRSESGKKVKPSRTKAGSYCELDVPETRQTLLLPFMSSVSFGYSKLDVKRMWDHMGMWLIIPMLSNVSLINIMRYHR